MIVRNILAEWTKLRSTAAFWWTSGLILLLTIGLTLLMYGLGDMPAIAGVSEFVVSSYWTGSLIVVVVMATMIVTTEYRYKVSGTNFQVTPQRWEVAVAKLVLYVVISAILAFVTMLVSYLIANALIDGGFDWANNPAAQRSLWAVPLSTALMVVFCQGIGWLLRQTAGAITLVLFWWLALEMAIQFLPKVGEWVFKYLPMHNLNEFVLDAPGPDWGLGTSLAVFTAWAVGLWIAGVATLQARDA